MKSIASEKLLEEMRYWLCWLQFSIMVILINTGQLMQKSLQKITRMNSTYVLFILKDAYEHSQ